MFDDYLNDRGDGADFFNKIHDMVYGEKIAYAKQRLEENPDNKIAERLLNSYNIKLSMQDFNRISDAIMSMYGDMSRNGGKIPVVPDKGAAIDKLNKLVSSNNKQYRKWINDMFAGVVEKEGVYNGRDIFA